MVVVVLSSVGLVVDGSVTAGLVVDADVGLAVVGFVTEGWVAGPVVGSAGLVVSSFSNLGMVSSSRIV